MKNKDFLLSMILSILIGLFVMAVIKSYEVQTPEIVKVDTTSDEYFEKKLDSFFFDHSKIPND